VIYVQPATADAPRPSLPYVTIEWTTDIAMSATPYEATTDTEVARADPDSLFEAKIEQTRRGTCNLTYYGNDALDSLVLLHTSLRLPAIRELTRDRGISIIRAGEITDTTDMRSTQWEPAASVDYWVYYSTLTTYDGGAIDTVDTTLTLT